MPINFLESRRKFFAPEIRHKSALCFCLPHRLANRGIKFNFLNWGIDKLLSYAINLYQQVISPFLPPVCRFYPSCSEYALLALKEYGLSKGIILTILRIIRCQPFGTGGIDFPERMYQKIWKTPKG